MTTATATRPKVTLGIQGDRIAADIPYSFGGSNFAKKVPGAKPVWDKSVEPNKFKYWSYPLNMVTCRTFRELCGYDLEILPSLTEWAWDQRRAEDQIEDLRAGGISDLPNVREEAPVLWKALRNRPYQIAGAALLALGEQVCLGDEPRLGKTYQALAAMIEFGAERVLIACPKTAVRSVWAVKIRELLGEEAYVAQGDWETRFDIIDEYNDADGPRFLIINKEMIRVVRMYQCPDGKELQRPPRKKGGCQQDHPHKSVYYPEYPGLFEQPWDGLIIDECHNVLASNKNTMSDGISQVRLGACRLPVAAEYLKLPMSGTPWRERLDYAWGVLNWMLPEEFSSYWKFAEYYFGTTPGWGMSSIVNKTLKDQAAWDMMLRRHVIARTKAEVAPQLPPVDIIPVLVDLDEKQQCAYDEIEDMGMTRLADGKMILANGTLPELTRMRQFACAYGRMVKGEFVPALPSSKLDWVLQFLEERKDLDGKVVIASQFTKLINFFARHIKSAGWDTVLITGEVTGPARDAAQDMFQNGAPRVVCINMYAGGEAIDLSAADEMIILDEPWVEYINKQVENRIVSLAKRQKITVYRLRGAGTIEEEIAQLTDDQREQLIKGKIDVLPKYAAKVAARRET